MNIYSKEGDKVRALFDKDSNVKNGRDSEKETAGKYLKPNKVYTIDRTEVHSWHTDVYLKEFGNIPFNSVHFENVPELKAIKVKITKKQHEFLNLIQHEDAANNLSQSIQWCIDSCMKIEKLYGIDASYIAHNDIRVKENQP